MGVSLPAMNVIVLSAGQGRRLLPLTETIPKCLLPVRDGEPLLALQLQALARAGVERANVMVGFGADAVEEYLAHHPIPGLLVETLYNPFFASSDNLMTCWLARSAMQGDFLLLNGDTLFADPLLERVLSAPAAPIRVTCDHKTAYDEDDMKVSLDPTGRLLAISKALPSPCVSGESIGMLLFRGSGPKRFVEGLELAVREATAMSRWYLSVVHDIAQTSGVDTTSIRGLWWQEIDSPEDLTAARSHYA